MTSEVISPPALDHTCQPSNYTTVCSMQLLFIRRLCVYVAVTVFLYQLVTVWYWEASPLLQHRDADASEAKMALLRDQNEALRGEIEELKKKVTTTKFSRGNGQRDFIVPSMCRCSSGNLPVPQASNSSQIDDTGILQEGSRATGGVAKHFLLQKSACDCRTGGGEKTIDDYLKNMEKQYCGETPLDSKMNWAVMPDFGVEQKLPVFLGVLSFKSPRTLDASLTNWEKNGLADLGFSGAFLQLNARSDQDDAVIAKHNKSAFGFHVTGSPDENIHPGLAIARFCRAAERSANGHPNGENLLLFLEKDWHVIRSGLLQGVLDSVNTLVQRGVPYVRLSQKVSMSAVGSWQCDAQGMTWDCTTAHQHRYTNLPSVLRCDWFLRYLEPYALIEDSIMFGCRRGFRQKKYFDWEEAMQDGRIAWTNSQWVVASYKHGSLFTHVEVDT